MKSKYSISVVYPAYNEEESIEGTIKRSVDALDRLFENFEIIIVNDASTDTTSEIAERLASQDSRIRIIHNQKNLRQGESLLKAFGTATGDLITHNGVDYPFDLDDLALMLPLIETNDVVAASRTGRPGYTVYRLFLSHANRILLHMLFDLRLEDYSFVQLYKREVVQTLLGSMKGKSTGFAMPEMMLRADDNGFKVTEVKIKYLPREAGVARRGTESCNRFAARCVLVLDRKIVQKQRKQIENFRGGEMTFIPSPLQKIAPDVVIGEDVFISDFVNLYGCTIGSQTKIGPFVEIQKQASVGNRCKISSHTFICEGVTIEDEVFVGHGVVFINDRIPRATAPDGKLQTEADWVVRKTLVKKGASIGSGAVIMCDVTIGERAVIGAGAVVLKDVADGAIVAGNPSRIIGSNK